MKRYGLPCCCLVMLAFLLSLPGACTSYQSRNGVVNTWRGENAPVFTKGESTQEEVIQALGPPSQIINMGNKPVFYYLHEQREGSGVILILFNYSSETVTYDRAIFFFDEQGVLEDFAFSKEAAEHEPEKP